MDLLLSRHWLFYLRFTLGNDSDKPAAPCLKPQHGVLLSAHRSLFNNYKRNSSYKADHIRFGVPAARCYRGRGLTGLFVVRWDFKRTLKVVAWFVLSTLGCMGLQGGGGRLESPLLQFRCLVYVRHRGNVVWHLYQSTQLYCLLRYLFSFWLNLPPPPNLISKRTNAIILWIPQDSFGEKNYKTLKNDINKNS